METQRQHQAEVRFGIAVFSSSYAPKETIERKSELKHTTSVVEAPETPEFVTRFACCAFSHFLQFFACFRSFSRFACQLGCLPSDFINVAQEQLGQRPL